jgi:hypothetical protein
LVDSFAAYGKADTYWVCVVYLALRDDIVGDVRRYDSHSPQDEDVWLEEAVASLMPLGIVSKDIADRLLCKVPSASFCSSEYDRFACLLY